jgi:hypothetical protein
MSKRAAKIVTQTKSKEEQSQYEKRPEPKRKETRLGFFGTLFQMISIWGSIIIMFTVALWINYVFIYHSTHLNDEIKQVMHFSKHVTIPCIKIQDREILPEMSFTVKVSNFSFLSVFIAFILCWYIFFWGKKFTSS